MKIYRRFFKNYRLPQAARMSLMGFRKIFISASDDKTCYAWKIDKPLVPLEMKFADLKMKKHFLK